MAGRTCNYLPRDVFFFPRRRGMRSGRPGKKLTRDRIVECAGRTTRGTRRRRGEYKKKKKKKKKEEEKKKKLVCCAAASVECALSAATVKARLLLLLLLPAAIFSSSLILFFWPSSLLRSFLFVGRPSGSERGLSGSWSTW